MRFVTTREASQLTGLSTEKLREWTNRRALIPADVKPKCQGSPAKYSWQTILLLRIARTLRDQFHLELHAHRQLFADLKRELEAKSFIALWGKSLAIRAEDGWAFVDESEPESFKGDAILIRLTPHLDPLSVGFALPNPSKALGQLDLFPILALSEKAEGPHVHNDGAIKPAAAEKRRRSA